MKKLNRAELIGIVANKLSMSNAAATKAVSAVCDTISDHLCAGQNVELRGIGVFHVKQFDERKQRNPQTGEMKLIPAMRRVKFKPSQSVTATLNA